MLIQKVCKVSIIVLLLSFISGCFGPAIEKMPKILEGKNRAETSAWLKKHGYTFGYIDSKDAQDRGYELAKNGNRIIFINPDIISHFDDSKSSIFKGIPVNSVSVDNIRIDFYHDYVLLYVKGVGSSAFQRYTTQGHLGGVTWMAL